ncbi:MAG TPA: hypothetical protein VKZ18_18180 [Polyangia bacterium]|nr:hypothetical protein [Polyangia bacterium]
MSEQKWQFEQDGLIINASRANGKGTVSWCGVSDSRTPALFLRPILRELSEKLKGAEVTVDFSKLEYMNSATVSPLINFVKALDGSCARTMVLFAENDWQRTHLQCMRAIATTLRNTQVTSTPV